MCVCAPAISHPITRHTQSPTPSSPPFHLQPNTFPSSIALTHTLSRGTTVRQATAQDTHPSHARLFPPRPKSLGCGENLGQTTDQTQPQSLEDSSGHHGLHVLPRGGRSGQARRRPGRGYHTRVQGRCSRACMRHTREGHDGGRWIAGSLAVGGCRAVGGLRLGTHERPRCRIGDSRRLTSDMVPRRCMHACNADTRAGRARLATATMPWL